MRKLNIGLIGCGKITERSHIPEMLKLGSKIRIKALYDLNEKTASALKEQFSLDCEICTSVDAMLGIKELDGVIISTPNNTHCELTLKALEAGKNVLVEKPMAVSLKDADKMIKAAEKKRLHLQVNQSLRFIPAYVKIKNLIDSGKIGQPLHIRCIRAGSSSPDKGWAPGSKWFTSKAHGGGIVMDIAVHMADMLGWYFGKVKSIYSLTKSRIDEKQATDNAISLFDFENGASGVLELSWTIPTGAGMIEIYGTKGTIRMGSNGIELILPGKKKPQVIKPGKAKGSHQYFVDGISGKANVPSPLEIGRKSLAYCLAIEESGTSGKPVKPKL
ncbi:MAG: hypothetical protein A2X49_11220 [Lentisphaerae bacterium GWF2_52_8]|nr:MAG: hypothetical protein A2X49_11220 [Lentisphaerae bacterium GWF2_52_8]